MLLHVADCSLVVIVNCQSADLVLSPSSLSPPYLERRGEKNELEGGVALWHDEIREFSLSLSLNVYIVACSSPLERERASEPT